MKITTRILIFAILLVNAACSNKDSIPYNPEAIKKEVEQVLNKYISQVNGGGLGDAAGFFADDPRFYWVEDGTVQYPDKTTLVKGIEALAPEVNSVHMTVSAHKTDVIDAQHAMLFVQYKEDIVLKSGYTIKLDGIMTILMERQNKAWKFLSGHSSVKKPRTTS